MTERAYNDMQSPMAARFTQSVTELNHERQWGLDLAQQMHYAAALAAVHPNGCPEVILGRVVVAYHLDHKLVQALADHNHHAHLSAWLSWMPQVLAVLRHAGLGWSNDAASDLDDLAQVASLELARSLANYRYESRFSSWAFQVIVRSVRNELRTHQAKKRSGQMVYIEGSGAFEVPLADDAHPESITAVRLLISLANTTLAKQPDKRLAGIFRLWALEDRRVVEIGAKVGLSPARVRVLLAQIVDLLRNDVKIRAWLVDEELRAPDS